MLIALGINAQNNNAVDSMVTKLNELDIPVIHQRSNNGRGHISESYSTMLHLYEPCTSECKRPNKVVWNDTDLAQKARDKYNRERSEQVERAVSTIRQEVEKLMPKAEEAYHFESHKKTGDTINYSLCLKYSDDEDDEIRKETYRDQIYFSNAIETLSFEYQAQPVPDCNKHKRGWGRLEYVRNEQLPSGETLPFDWEGYSKLIMPLLKQKGIKTRTFRWAQDNHPDYMKNELFKDYSTKSQIANANGKTTKGETTGVIYTIPCDKQELAIALLDSLTSLTERYIDEHQDQQYAYNYGMKFTPNDGGIPKGFATNHRMLQVFPEESFQVRHFINVAMNSDGYHILVYKTHGALWFPREWYQLKSIIDGVKTYYK